MNKFVSKPVAAIYNPPEGHNLSPLIDTHSIPQSIKVIIKGYEIYGILITFYNPFNLVTSDVYAMFEEKISRIITYFLIPRA